MKTNNAWKKRFVAGAAFLACVGAALTLEASVSISLTPTNEVTNGVPVTVTAPVGASFTLTIAAVAALATLSTAPKPSV